MANPARRAGPRDYTPLGLKKSAATALKTPGHAIELSSKIHQQI
jgi:hypothetical protein